MHARFLPFLLPLLLAALLLATGCTGPPAISPGPGPGPVVLPATPTGPEAEECTLDPLQGDTGMHFLREDSCYFRYHTPVDFLGDLQEHSREAVMVLDVPEDWISREQAGLLMGEIGSSEPAAAVVSPLSSYWPFNRTSTVGNEALFLLEGYRTGRYPPALCSLYYFRPDRTEMREWWDRYGSRGLPDKQEAIRLIEHAYPELEAWPSDGLPPRSTWTERAPGGWYVAFLQEGSGLPILSARCFFVSDNRTLMETGMVNQSIMVLPHDFSPERCGA